MPQRLWVLAGTGQARRIGRIGVALAISITMLSVVSASASARTFSVGHETAVGTISCAFSATIEFSPPLTRSGGGTNPSLLRKPKVSGCTASGTGATSSPRIEKPKLAGSFAQSPLRCAATHTTGASANLELTWDKAFAVAYRNATGNESSIVWQPAKLTPSVVSDFHSSGSFPGAAAVTVNVPPTLASRCSPRRGIDDLKISGSITLGSGSRIDLYPVTAATARTVGVSGPFKPTDLTAGPGGVMWFLAGGGSSAGGIGRITSSGLITIVGLSGMFPTALAAGPDGAMWFTNESQAQAHGFACSGNAAIGRITSSGVVTYYSNPSLSPEADIVRGPDGARRGS